MLVAYLAADTFFTLFLTPCYALGAELSADPDERTRIVAIRTGFWYAGSIVGSTMPFLAAAVHASDLRAGYGQVAFGFGAAATVAISAAFFGTREPPPPPPRPVSIGAFFGFWSFALELAAGTGPPVVGGVLGALGYTLNVAQPPQVLLAMKLLYGPTPPRSSSPPRSCSGASRSRAPSTPRSRPRCTRGAVERPRADQPAGWVAPCRPGAPPRRALP